MAQNIFVSGTFPNYLVFTPAKKYIKYFNNTTQTYLWKSNGMSEKSIENIIKSHNLFAQTFLNHDILPDVNFNGHYLKIFLSLKR